jgi:hypothetical protein
MKGLGNSSELTVSVQQFVVCFRSFCVNSAELKDLRQKGVSPVLDVGQHIVQRVLQLEAAGQHREQVRDACR